MQQKAAMLGILGIVFVALLAMSNSGFGSGNIGGKATVLSNRQIPSDSLPSLPPQALASASCSTIDPECSTGVVDGCDVRVDLTFDADYTLPMGIDICADDVSVDCRGYTISGDRAIISGIGIANEGHNGVTIKNCVIENHPMGIKVSPIVSSLPPTDNQILNNVVRDGGTGIMLNLVDYSLVKSNLIVRMESSGIRLYHSDHNTIELNTIRETGGLAGIDTDMVSNNLIAKNLIEDNYATYGLKIGRSRWSNHITMNRINRNAGTGMLFYFGSPPNDPAEAAQVEWNHVCDNSEYDIAIYSDFPLDIPGDSNTCDTTNNWNDDGTIGCTFSCGYVPVCGNGVIEFGEECDDGNFDGHDGCNAQCQTCGTYADQCCDAGAPRCFARGVVCTSPNGPGTCICDEGTVWDPGSMGCVCENGGIYSPQTGVCIPSNEPPPRLPY